MKTLLVGVGALFICGASSLNAQTYSTIADSNVIVTGVRPDDIAPDNVVLTGSYNNGDVVQATLYRGTLADVIGAPSTSWHLFTPDFGPTQAVTSSTFYGPNTSKYDASIAAGEVRAVGSYKYSQAEFPAFDHGMIYQGDLDGNGTWKQIDATSLATGGATVYNTIAHSNMGTLVVGNYDTDAPTGNAFVYDMSKAEGAPGQWTDLKPVVAASVTAYGIWHNGGVESTSYVIAGGFSNVLDGTLDEGYLVHYDSATGDLDGFKEFHFMNDETNSLVTHFDGITLAPGGFNLTGDYVSTLYGEGGFLAFVGYDSTTMTFGEAVWLGINFPIDGSVTSGNTVVGDSVLGIYTDGGTHSFVATVPEPGTWMLASIGLALVLIRSRQRLVA